MEAIPEIFLAKWALGLVWGHFDERNTNDRGRLRDSATLQRSGALSAGWDDLKESWYVRNVSGGRAGHLGSEPKNQRI